jgi:pimeloyl-ACP methyl ester carboxylesterase
MNYLKLLFLLILPSSLLGQVKGDWYGMLDIGAVQIPLVIHINDVDNTILLDSPDQQVKGKKTDTCTTTKGQIYFEIREWNVLYKGEYDPTEDKIIGDFLQNGYDAKLNFQRTEIEKRKIKRPQNPPSKVSYEIVEVKFKNKKGKVVLNGTLTIPIGKGPFPAVVLASGSGQQDRNEEMVKHKPFHVIAHHLTSNGIMVLRFDDRFYGESSKKFYNSSMEDFAGDVSSAVNYLRKNKKVDREKLGVIGHSEGGIHAPIAASQNENIKFIISLAGVGVNGIDLLIKQRHDLLKIEGVTFESTLVKDSLFMRKIFAQIQTEEGLTKADTKKFLTEFFDDLTEEEYKEYGDSKEIIMERIPEFFDMYSMRSFLEYEPKKYWDQIDLPLLALNGSRDIQVDPDQNIAGFKSLSDHPKTETIVFEGLNHLFQKCESCLLTEYGILEQTIEVEVLEKMLGWIKKL